MTPLAKGVSLSPTTMMARSTPSPCIFSVMSWEQKGQGRGRQRRFGQTEAGQAHRERSGKGKGQDTGKGKGKGRADSGGLGRADTVWRMLYGRWGVWEWGRVDRACMG